MGLLTTGTPLSWDEIVPLIPYIKEHGITQFINLYHRYKDRKDVPFVWGDEMEYTIVKFEHENHKVRVSLRSSEILKKLDELREHNEKCGIPNPTYWMPEYAAFQIEGTPNYPYKSTLDSIKEIEPNLNARRKLMLKFLDPDEALMSMSYIALGTPDFTYPYAEPTEGQASRSIFTSDKIINPYSHRYKVITENAMKRHGRKAFGNVPIFKDKCTPSPFKEQFPRMDPETRATCLDDHIYLDHNVFSDGMCCLQVTIQAENIDHARWLNDQLTVFTPILMALSAASPIYRGYLSEHDARWGVMTQICDDRTELERDPTKPQYITKSRHGTTDCYIHPTSEKFNDELLKYNEAFYQQLVKNGIDHLLALHVAHLFNRDPLQIYKERLHQNDEIDTEHFETIHTSNWNNLRFKVPIEEKDMGWRIEFRTNEIQITDFENAAYACFIMLLVRVLFAYNLNFIMPISLVTENMKKAEKIDAVNKQKFYFGTNNNGKSSEITINEIINGNENFEGILPIIKKYIADSKIDSDLSLLIEQYLTLIQDRASGKTWTLAKWMRNFVRNHPDYKFDSKVEDSIVYDMVKTLHKFSKNEDYDSRLLGPSFQSRIDEELPN